MIKIERNKDLSGYNTLKMESLADYFVVIKNKLDLHEVFDWAKNNDKKIFVLGGGSNILLRPKIDYLVLKNEIKGIKVLNEDDKYVYLQAYSGEWWTTMVNFAILNKWSGIENLYYVPGTVGAAPVQNIGAYGVELKDTFYELEAFNLETGQLEIFTKKDCQFGYRDSIFKSKKNTYFITKIILKLNKQVNLKLNYGDIKKKLEEAKVENPSLKEVAQVIREIRDSKLPNPAVLANAGSFFKNPVINKNNLDKLKVKYPEIKYFDNLDGQYKVPAGWLIEQAGFKGKRIGNVGMHEKQALILVNYGGASYSELINLINLIQEKIFEMFSIKLELEVNII
jgi:UDP-N-acetylmuramate dehydrogenase